MNGLQEVNEGTCRIERPASDSPWVFACPHAGRHYPADLLARTRLRPPALRRSEDALVDALFESAAAFAPLLIAQTARAYVDVNRAPDELDPDMFDGPLPCDTTQTPRVAAGFGAIARILREGIAIYDRPLPPEEAVRRIALYHAPYHAALQTLIAEAKARFGFAVVIDCHSMPGRRPADIVLGDRFKTSAAPGLCDAFERAFRDQGFTVARNTPYAGGYTTATYGQPAAGIHALQIEIGRALYLDEARVERGPAFDAVKQRVGKVLQHIAAADIAVICGARSLAAE